MAATRTIPDYSDLFSFCKIIICVSGALHFGRLPYFGGVVTMDQSDLSELKCAMKKLLPPPAPSVAALMVQWGRTSPPSFTCVVAILP